jgi:hypothetical protein
MTNEPDDAAAVEVPADIAETQAYEDRLWMEVEST